MSYNKNKKSVAESIINGNYNANDFFTNDGKQKKSVSESIINGTYNAEDFFPSSVTKKTTTTNENKSWISNLLGDIGNIGSNVVKSAESGLLQFGKTISMRMQEGLNDRANIATEQMENLIEKDKRYSDEEKEQLLNKLDQEKQKNVVNIDKYQEKIDTLNREMAENTEKTSNGVSRKIAELSQSIGNNLVGMGVSAINPGLGITYFTGSATGSYYDEAKQRGMEEDDAKLYAGVMGAMEGITEKVIAGENIKGVKAILNGSGFKSALKSFGIEIGENFLQEAVMPSLSELTTKAVAGNKYLQHDYTSSEGWKELLGDSFSDGIDGSLSSIILGGATRGIASSNQLINKIKSGEKVTQQEVKTAVQDAQKSGVNVEEILQEEIKKNATNKIQQQEQISPIIKQEQNGTMAPIETNKEQNIENKQNLVYNVNSESEDGVNDGYKRDIIERGNRLHEEHEQQQNRQYSWEEYNKWEQSIKPIETNKLTNDERQSINRAKTEYNKDVYLYDENVNDNTYSGGASQIIEGKITISRQSAEQFGLNNMIEHENIESDILHNDKTRDILSPVIDYIMEDTNFNLQKESFWKNQKGNIPTDYLIAKDIICDRFSEIRQNQKLDYDNVLSNATNSTIDNALSNYYYQVYGKELENSSSFNLQQNNIAPIEQQPNVEPPIIKNNKVMNPNEISQLTKQDASTTPDLPNKNIARGNKESSFYKNITQTSQAYNDIARKTIANDENVKYYKGVTNEQSLQEATKKLDNGGTEEVLNWINRDSKKATATDVAEGWVLLKRYQDNGDYDAMVNVAKKMREIATTSGQTVQMFNLMSRMTPEGMVKYAQSELSEAFKKLSENKTKEWIEQNKIKFDLTPNETEFIVNNMKEIQEMNTEDYINNQIQELNQKLSKTKDSNEIKQIKQELKTLKLEDIEYLKKTKLAEIQKLLSEKLPTNIGQSLKSWMRISMLFNPKTQVRNVLGNAIILPVNSVSDVVATAFDKAISKKTGVRTTGLTNIKSNLEGFSKGIYESYTDFKKGINTRNIEGNRFEVSEGKNFTEKTVIGKTLNRIDNLNSFLLDAGDRGFYEAAFTNSINNQMVLNKSDIITKDMIDIATNEALSRTWQDNNNYTKFVLNIRNGLNKIGINNYGLGDVLIPFAKTPANLTKAIVDYSPVGLVNTIIDGVNLKRGLLNGQYTPQMQHKFVQDLGKATAGTMLYILGTALAKAGITSGEGDDDKDVNNFIKNTLGINSYSIKINGHSFTYDWAQPIAAPLSITANIVNSENKETALMEAIVGSLDTAGSILLEQSFLQSINDVLTNNDGVISGLINEVLELPVRAIPTLMKQIADMTDSTVRQSYVSGKPVESAINSIKSKIPVLNKTLAPSVDTLGNEIQKYGGENTIFNVFFNPASVNAENLNEAGSEIYRIYKETGDKTIMPRVAPYSINYNNEKIQLSSEQRAEFQKISGNIVQDSIDNLLNNKLYLNLEDSKKAEILTDIANYAYNKAQSEIIGTDLSSTYQSVDDFISIGGTVDKYYTFKNNIDDTSAETKKNSVINTLLNMNDLTDFQKSNLYGKYYSNEDTLNLIVNSAIDFNEFLKYSSQNIISDKDSNGNTINGSKKGKVISAVNSLNLNIAQKAILIKNEYSSFNEYNNEIVSYVKGLKISYNKKKLILENLNMTVSEDGSVSWKK